MRKVGFLVGYTLHFPLITTLRGSFGGVALAAAQALQQEMLRREREERERLARELGALDEMDWRACVSG